MQRVKVVIKQNALEKNAVGFENCGSTWKLWEQLNKVRLTKNAYSNIATVWKVQKSLILPQSSLPSPTDTERCTISPQSRSHVCWGWSVPNTFVCAAPAWSVFAACTVRGYICHKYDLHPSATYIHSGISLLAGVTHR